MVSKARWPILFLLLAMGLAACAGPATAPPAPSQPPPSRPAPAGSATPAGQASAAGWLSAREAVALAYANLPDAWKDTAKLAFVGRYSHYCNTKCSPLVVEDDPGIGSDGRQAHWVVIFAKDASASPAQAFYVETDKVTLVAEDLAVIRPDELFDREGWVDSTEIRWHSSQPAGLELRTSDLFEDVDAELATYPLLWLAETSFGRFDVYDARTGQFIKSR